MSSGDEPTPDREIEIELLLEAIFRKYHYDFRHYSRASLSRRLTHAAARFDCRSLSALQERILYEPEIFPDVLDFLTIQVSGMFRDPSYFLALRRLVAPILRTYPSLKIWVAGCSTGEEAYSLAILLREEGLLDRTTIYATDINPAALRRAESGVYEISRIPDFTRSYQQTEPQGAFSDYYTAAYGAAVLDKSLRKNIVFADHSLATDAVFSEFQLISCRNVLIYFDRELQNRAVDLFYEALCRRGFVGLGSHEHLRLAGKADCFEEFAREDRIFRKK